jgi:multiple sugar transport system substrate-binding protein
MKTWKGILLALVAATPAAAQDLSISCRCVSGGANAELADWIKESVIPGFQAAHSGVTVTLNEVAGGDEQLTQQLALDFSTGAGADIAGFDGFLIPNFVEAGLLKPISEVAGAGAMDWEGWGHISDGAKALMSYEG